MDLIWIQRDGLRDRDVVRALNGAPAGITLRVCKRVLSDVTESTLCLGDLFWIRRMLTLNGRRRLPMLDYPEELAPFFGRQIRMVTGDQLPTLRGEYFVKHASTKGPIEPAVYSFPDHEDFGLASMDESDSLWVSEPLEIRSEWRCFLTSGRIVDVRPYRPDSWRSQPDPNIVEAAASAWTTAPAGCCIDFAVDSRGRTVVVEVNDGYGLGSYGLAPDDYYELLAARWGQFWVE